NERIAELDRRLVHLADDAERERRLAADAQAALARLEAEEAALVGDADAAVEREGAITDRVGAAEATLSASETTFAEITAALADLGARRSALDRAIGEHSERLTRLGVDAQKLGPPAIDLLSVDKGYEAALAAALGDDLEVPVDPAASMRWAGAPLDPADPELPPEAEPLARHVNAPPELARRLAQIGVVERADGTRLAATLKAGQRLVSRDGDLWRWDGFAAAANAPTASARRLAQKNRFVDLERELGAVRIEAETSRRRMAELQTDLKAAIAAEGEARTLRRETQ